MTIDEMIGSLTRMKEKLGTGSVQVPICNVGPGKNEYIVPEYGIVCALAENKGKLFQCAFVGSSTGDGLTKYDEPIPAWNPVSWMV